jgi:AmmeMemoRadiSam system protein A
MALVGAFIMPHPPVIIPAVGKGEEKKIWRTTQAYQKAARQIAELQPETIVVTTPHSVLYADYLHISPGSSARGDFSQFGAKGNPEEFSYDTAFVAALTDESKKAGIPAGTFGEKDPAVDHGSLVPLTFVNEVYHGYRLVRCSLSGLGPLVHYNYGRCIRRTAEKLNRRTVLIASGDLSHKLKEDGPYGFAEEGPQFDRQVTDAMKSGDFLRFLTFDSEFCDAAAECGLRSFMILAGAFDGLAVKPDFLSYEGPFGVGYAVCSFLPAGQDESRRFGGQYLDWKHKSMQKRREKEDGYVRLARLALETRVAEGHRANLPEGLSPDLLDKQAGVFVSIKKDGGLRGCIGTIFPTQRCIADEIMHNAVSAGLHDPRFSPVAKEELSSLVYSVDVLGKPESVPSIEKLDAKRYGVIVRSGERCGLLLPDLPGVDTPLQQVEIALRKGGIRRDEAFRLERFEVVRHK